MQNSKESVSVFTVAYYTCFLNYRNISDIYCPHSCDTMYLFVHVPSFGGTFKLHVLFWGQVKQITLKFSKF